MPALVALSTMGPFDSEIMFYTRAWPILLAAVQCATIVRAWSLRNEASFENSPVPSWLVFLISPLFVIMAAALVINAFNLQLGLARLALLALQLFFAKAFYDLMRSHWARFHPYVLPGLAIATIATSLLLPVYLIRAISDPQFDWVWLGFSGWHLRSASHVMTALVPIALCAFVLGTGRNRIAFMMASLLGMTVILWSGARAPFLSVLLAMLASTIYLPWVKARRLLAAFSAVTLVGGLLSLVHQPPHPAYGVSRIFFSGGGSQGSTNDVSSGRLEIWRNTIEIIGNHPWVGIGDGQFVYAYIWREQMAHAHNFALQFWAQWGLVGGSLAITIVMAILLKSHLIAKKHPEIATPASLAIIAIIALATIDYSFNRYLPFFFLAILLGWLLTIAERPNAHDRSR